MIPLEPEKQKLTTGQIRRIETINEIVGILEKNREVIDTLRGEDALVFTISRVYGFNVKTARDYFETARAQMLSTEVKL